MLYFMMKTMAMMMSMVRGTGSKWKPWRGSSIAVLVIVISLMLLIDDVATAVVNTPQPIENFSAKLVNGSVANTGLLLVHYRGTWGTVCDDSWDLTNAHVVCRQLGYPGAAVAMHEESTNRQDHDKYPILLDEVRCAENSSHLLDCQFEDPLEHNCQHKEDVYLLCQLPQPSDPALYSLRLRGGEVPSEGRLEVFYHGVWGMVCDDHFTDVSAYVACRELGYPYSLSLLPKSAYQVPSTAVMLLDDVRCKGNEGRLWDCDHRNLWNHNCDTRTEVVGIRCSQEPSIPAGRAARLVPNRLGLVEIFYDGIWWNICADSHWDRRDALVVCKQKGFTSGLPQRQPLCPWTATDCHAKFGQFRCKGTESSLEECQFTTEDLNSSWTCRHGYAVATCSNIEPDEDWWLLDSYNLTDIDVMNSTIVPVLKKKKYLEGDVRLSGSERDHEGRVEIYYDNEWYTVCDDSWDINDARVVCHQLGFPDAHRAVVRGTFGPGIVDILLDNVECKGDEANLLQCDHNQLHSHDCFHSEDAAVICQLDPSHTYTTQPSRLSNRLPPGAIIAISMISTFSFIIIGGALLYYACKSCDRRIEETSPRPRSTPMVVMMVHSTSRTSRNNGYSQNNRRYDALPFTICSRTSIASSTASPLASPVSQNGTICEELEALSGAPPSYEIVLRHPDAFAQMLQNAEITAPPSYNRCISQQ